MIQVLPVPPHTLRANATLAPIVDYWREIAGQPHHPLASTAREVVAKVEACPEIAGPVSREMLTRHRELSELLLSCVFPSSLQRFAFSAICTPGSFDVHWATPRFERELMVDGKMAARVVLDGMSWDQLQRLFQYLMLGRLYYGLEIPFEKSVVLEKPDPSSGLLRYYQLRAHFDHMKLVPPDEIVPLDEEQRADLYANLHDLELWHKLIPAEQFRMDGVIVYEAFEITEEMTLSAMKEALVAPGCLTNPARFLKLRDHFRQLLGVGDLELEIGARHLDRVLVFNGGEAAHTEPFCGKALDKEVFVTGDLSHCCQQHPLLNKAVQCGARSLLVMPLADVGFLALFSQRKGALHTLVPMRLQEIVSQLAVAVQRALDAIENRVQRVMKEQFTAIHSSVEWRFRQQALDIVRGQAESQDLVFANVFPLFGTSDVRNSTHIRNQAIQADLRSQLELGQAVLQAAIASRDLPYLRSRHFILDRWLQSFQRELQSGDESRVAEFLKYELEPLFERLQGFSAETDAAVTRYRESLDPKLGIVHVQRKRYEDSMAMIRDRVCDVLNRAQESAQATFPHYFELNKTDGVDHTMYIGGSLCLDGDFDMLYLKNLRLWQLETMLEITQSTRDLELPMRLETAHLILVQDQPLSIRYGLEEKHFNVDGAYNARYEILKKRIDKAEVRDTGERLTQPGKLAVVYSNRREHAEYLDYLEYLRNIGKTSGLIEDLELSPLQGVQGLRALRVTGA